MAKINIISEAKKKNDNNIFIGKSMSFLLFVKLFLRLFFYSKNIKNH